MEEKNIINISRNLSRVDEMHMESEKFILQAAIESTGDGVKTINNGAITDAGTGEYLGSFNAQGLKNLSMSLQGIGSRDVRRTIYDAVEDFVQGVTEKVIENITEIHD